MFSAGRNLCRSLWGGGGGGWGVTGILIPYSHCKPKRSGAERSGANRTAQSISGH